MMLLDKQKYCKILRCAYDANMLFPFVNKMYKKTAPPSPIIINIVRMNGF